MSKHLFCLAFHWVPDRLKYLHKVIANIADNYKGEVKILIDTNSSNPEDAFDLCIRNCVEVFFRPNLEHPFHLTRYHRKHIVDLMDQYDVVSYLEDDHLLPYDNYAACLEKYDMMWPNFVPTFIRIEESDGKQYISDVPKHYRVEELGVTSINGRLFTSFRFPHNYNGFWMMPTKYLKENITPDFTKMTDAREWSAMYPTWELNKKGLIEVYQKDNKWYIHENNYSWHLPNNYIGSSMGNASIEVNEIFI